MKTKHHLMISSGKLAFKTKSYVYYLCVSLVMIWGCGGVSESPEVAMVDGAALTLADFRAQSSFMGLGADPMALTEDLRLAVLDTMIERRLVVAAGEAKGIELSQSDLEAAEHRIKSDVPLEDFNRALTAQGLEYSQWLDVLKLEIYAQKVLDAQLAHQLRAPAEEILDYYQKHQQRFSHPEQILAQHTILPNKEMAQELLKRMEQGEEMSMAMEAMGMPTSESFKPDWLSRGHMPQALEEQIFKLEAGKVAGPFSSPYGFHVVKVLNKRSAETLTLNRAAEEIKQILLEDKKEKAAADYIEQLRGQAKIWTDARFVTNGQVGTARR